MKRIVLLVIVCAAVAATGHACVAQSTSAIEQLQRATVFLSVTKQDGGATGSGVLLSTDGLIATAAHVLKDGIRARVRLSSGEEFDLAGVFELDPQLDLALVKIPGFALPTASLGNSDSIRVGDRLLAIGAPLGLQGTVSDGLLSAVRIDDGTKRFQVSVPVSPGSSGGPVATADGRVIGLVVSGIRGGGAENLNFVLPFNYVRGRMAGAVSKPLVALAAVSQAAAAIAVKSDIKAAVESVNDSLEVDWLSLDGIEIAGEDKQPNNIRAAYRVAYSASKRPGGSIQVERLSTTRLRSKVAPLAPTKDLAEDTQRALIVVGVENSISFEAQRTPLAQGIAAGSTRTEVRGGAFSYNSSEGAPRSSTGLPNGILPSALAGAVIVGSRGPLPAALDYWVVNEATGELVQVKWRRTGVATRKAPILVEGVSCIGSAKVQEREVPVVLGVLSIGTQRVESSYRADAPHVLLQDSNKCVRIP